MPRGVGVRVPSPAQKSSMHCIGLFLYIFASCRPHSKPPQQPCTQRGGPQLQSPYHRPLHRCHPTPVKTDTSHASRHDSPHTHDFSPYFLQVCTQSRPITAQNDTVTRLFLHFLAGVYPNQTDLSPKRHRHTTFPPFSCMCVPKSGRLQPKTTPSHDFSSIFLQVSSGNCKFY